MYRHDLSVHLCRRDLNELANVCFLRDVEKNSSESSVHFCVKYISTPE
jgi:hypothetical protein